jgi:hypothetical protein
MAAIRVRAKVASDGTLTLQAPDGMPAGECAVLLTLEPRDEAAARRAALDALLAAQPSSVGEWPATLSLRRDELYDDWGR